ncbi:MAG: hypothetical protein PUP93_34285 [Rhizonema sp. NSF051]|nr:hypothetical protein [Rhizonema sp. NSF051]
METEIFDVHTILKQWFYAMLEPQPSLIARQITIRQEADNYIMQSEGKVHEAMPSLSETLPRTAGYAYAERKDLLQAVKYEVVMGLLLVHRELLWFHAGAVANDRGAVVFAAPGGGGKSTLVTQLYQQGWRYLSDDVLPLELATGNIFSFPQTPRVRQNTGELVPSDRLWEVPKLDLRLDLNTICRSPSPIQAIVFPNFDQQTQAQISPCSPGTAAIELLRNCINFTDHKQAAVQRICEIVKHLPAFKLSFSNIDAAIECLDKIS